MAQNSEKAKKNYFKALKAEFKKIVWPGKETVRKETISVVAATVFLGALIAVIDAVIKIGIDFIANIRL